MLDWRTASTGSTPASTATSPPCRRSARSSSGKIQDLILKDMVSARDEATPPAFKELVERYYEVLSKSGGSQ